MPCVSTTRCTIRFDTMDKHDIGFDTMISMIDEGTRKIRCRIEEERGSAATTTTKMTMIYVYSGSGRNSDKPGFK
jgi:hypothetical protein